MNLEDYKIYSVEYERKTGDYLESNKQEWFEYKKAKDNEEIEIDRDNERVLIKNNKFRPDMISEIPFSRVLEITYISE